jgi:hypothetical protein
MNEDHKPGRCDLCLQDQPVRWKNIYFQGSEGLTVCQPCENKIVRFVLDLRREAVKSRLNFEKEKRNGIKTI